ncbi:MAG TPA: hydrolase, partial [Companilactobacillus farciminis]|nr:hydrolase [Companilactobacillus farciminis]
MKKKLTIILFTLLLALGMPLNVQAAAAPKAKNLTSVTRSINHASPDTPLIFSHRGSPYNYP